MQPAEQDAAFEERKTRALAGRERRRVAGQAAWDAIGEQYGFGSKRDMQAAQRSWDEIGDRFGFGITQLQKEAPLLNAYTVTDMEPEYRRAAKARIAHMFEQLQELDQQFLG